MLTEEAIGGRVTGDDAAAELAAAAVVGEEPPCAAPRWRDLQIDGGGLLLGG